MLETAVHNDVCSLCTRAPQVVELTKACKIRSDAHDPLALLALLAWPRHST